MIKIWVHESYIDCSNRSGRVCCISIHNKIIYIFSKSIRNSLLFDIYKKPFLSWKPDIFRRAWVFFLRIEMLVTKYKKLLLVKIIVFFILCLGWKNSLGSLNQQSSWFMKIFLILGLVVSLNQQLSQNIIH